MFFTKRACKSPEPNINVSGERLQVVSDLKYLGIIIDANLSFKKQVKNVTNVIKFNLMNFRFIRDSLSMQAAKL